MILAQIAFGAALASRAHAGLIPVRVEQSPFGVDVLLEWTEEGTEEPLVLSGLDDWAIQVTVSDLTASSGEWRIRASVFHRTDPHEENRSGASGGIGTVFDNQLFGQVLDLERIVFHYVIVPNEGDPSPPLPHLDRLQLDVYRDPISDAAHPSTIHLRIEHVTEIPEPSSISLLLIALISVGLVHRRIRGRVMVRKTKLSGFLFVLLALRIPPPRVGAFLWASVKPIPFSGSHVMKYVFVTMAAITLQLAMALPDAAAEPVEYHLTAIDVPGAVSSRAFDINDSGQILVTFSADDGSGGSYVIGEGVMVQIAYPNGDPTLVSGMNNAGAVVGSRLIPIDIAQPGALTTTGFVYDGAAYSPLAVPGAGRTGVSDINDSGHIVGTSSASVGFGGPQEGFLYNGETFQTVVFPGAMQTSVTGINNLGQMVGVYGPTLNRSGFVFDGNEFLTLSVPGVEIVSPTAINDIGVVVGTFHTSSFDSTSAAGFIFADGEYQGIGFPGAVDTWISGINNEGEIVGYYSDASGTKRAFLGVPVPEPSSYLLIVLGVIILLMWRSRLERARHLRTCVPC